MGTLSEVVWFLVGLAIGVIYAGCYWTIWTNRFPWDRT